MRAIAIALLVQVLYLDGPAFAQDRADNYYDPAEMAAASVAMKESAGGQTQYYFQGERFEYRSNDGDSTIVWEGQAWIGGDLQKLWFKTDGDFATQGDRFAEAEVQALYSRAITSFWDLQAGIRHDIKPDPSRTYATIGFQGLAPYWFEIESALFVSNKGDVSLRLEGEYDFRLTQRLILQSRAELNGAFSDDAEIGVGAGFRTAEAGLRLRYEFTREFAPYVGISSNWTLGDSADIARASGEQTHDVSLVAGIRFWY